MSSPLGWTAALAGAAVAALALDRWLVGDGADGAALEPARVLAAEPSAEPPRDHPPAVTPGERADASGTVATSALDLLREHWGDRWEEIRARNHAGDEWLERYPIERLRPWEDVSELVLARALDAVAKERAREDYLLLSDDRGAVDLANATASVRTPHDVRSDFERVREDAKRIEGELRAAWTAYWDEVESVLAGRWRAGEVEHHPILASYDPPPDDALYVASGIAEGWAYTVALRASEEPALAELEAALERRRAAALDELAAALGAD